MSIVVNFNSSNWKNSHNRAVSAPRLILRGLATSRFAVYRVRRSGSGFASVCLSLTKNGNLEADCNCLAGLNKSCCYHIAAALLHHSALVNSGVRQSLEKPE